MPVERVLQVHTRYRQSGGEDAVVEAERRLLEAAGISVRQLLFDNADLREGGSIREDLGLAASAVWNGAALKRVDAAIRGLRPDVVHVHNTFAAASPTVLRARGAGLVQTLHNYRLVCPAAVAYRDGHPCTDCAGLPVPLPAVVHACVASSRRRSGVAAITHVVHRTAGTLGRVGAYIALTRFQREAIVRGGIAGERVHVVPNFREPDPGPSTRERSGVLFAGRLATEKGILPLLAAAPAAGGSIRIAGDGPLGDAVHAAAGRGDVEVLGQLSRTELDAAIGSALALVVPSTWFEGFPMVVLDAFAAGTPVIASRIGSLAEVVEDGNTGRLVEPGDPADLAEALRWAFDHPAELARMGVAARSTYEARYRGQQHLASLFAVYERVRADTPPA